MTVAAGAIEQTNTLSVWDRQNGTSFLVDTGADVCVFPACVSDRRTKKTPRISLLQTVLV